MGCDNSKLKSVDGAKRGKSAASAKGPAEQIVTPDFGVADWYTVHELLGRGGSGETWLCTSILTREKVAVKFIPRPIPRPMLPMINHEVKIQGDFGEGHLNIINAREALLSPSHLCLVMEYAAGGTLTKHVGDRWNTTHARKGLFLDEDEARYFFKQFIKAVEHLHKNNVVHRDLKLDNTLLDANDPPRIKLCDFGFARAWDEGNAMHTQIGTPVYMSPELISIKGEGGRGYDGRKVDVWASGVLLFVMLLGQFPFDHSEHPDPNSSAAHAEVWLQQIKTSWRENPRIADAAKKLSEECRDLLDKIFDLDESRRVGILEIKQHPWFTQSLSAKFAQAWQNLCEEQDDIDKRVEAGVFKSERRDNAINSMVEKAANVGKPGEKVFRVPLNRVQTRYSILVPEDVALAIAEELAGEDNVPSTAKLSKKLSLAELQSAFSGVDSENATSPPASSARQEKPAGTSFSAADI